MEYCRCQNVRLPRPIDEDGRQRFYLVAPQCQVDSSPIWVDHVYTERRTAEIVYTVMSDTPIRYEVYKLADAGMELLDNGVLWFNMEPGHITRQNLIFEVDFGEYMIRTICPAMLIGPAMCKCNALVTIEW